MKRRTNHVTASRSSSESPSIATRISWRAAIAPAFRASALPRLVARWTTLRRSYLPASSSRMAPVSSREPSLIADHLEIRIVDRVERREHLADVLALVVARHEDADGRVRLEPRRLAGPRLVPSAHEAVKDAAGHPVPRHHERVPEGEAGHHRDEEVPHRSEPTEGRCSPTRPGRRRRAAGLSVTGSSGLQPSATPPSR